MYFRMNIYETYCLIFETISIKNAAYKKLTLEQPKEKAPTAIKTKEHCNYFSFIRSFFLMATASHI